MNQNIYYSPKHNASHIEEVPPFVDNNVIEPKNLSFIKKYKNTIGVKLTGTIDNLWKVWGLLLEDEVIDKLKDLDTYNHDLVDLSVFILTNEFDIERKNFISAYKNKNLGELQESGEKLLAIIEDADKILSSDNIYLLDIWINKAIEIIVNMKNYLKEVVLQ